MNKMLEFWKRVEQEHKVDMKYAKGQPLRTGQIMMNVLNDMDNPLCSAISQTIDDPFHDDSKIPAFMNVVATSWMDEFGE